MNIKPDDRVKTPDGYGQVFEVSEMLGFCSVFLDGDDPLSDHPLLEIRRQSKRYAKIYNLKDIILE